MSYMYKLYVVVCMDERTIVVSKSSATWMGSSPWNRVNNASTRGLLPVELLVLVVVLVVVVVVVVVNT